jgi:hypothetical protein
MTYPPLPDPDHAIRTYCPNPHCGAGASVVEQFAFRNSDGEEVIHVKVRCDNGHWYMGSVELLYEERLEELQRISAIIVKNEDPLPRPVWDEPVDETGMYY